MQDAYRLVRMTMEAFEEAQSNLLIEVGGLGEIAAMYSEAKRIRPLMHQAPLAKGDIRILSR